MDDNYVSGSFAHIETEDAFAEMKREVTAGGRWIFDLERFRMIEIDTSSHLGEVPFPEWQRLRLLKRKHVIA